LDISQLKRYLRN